MRKSRRGFELFLIGGLLLSGCQKESSSPTILAQRPQPYVQDVPVPKGFEQDLRRSVHRVVAGRRSITHYYQGREGQRAVRDFYAHYMPRAEWQTVDEKLQAGVYLLNFKKNDETCEVRIENNPGTLLSGGSTLVRVTIRSMYDESPG